MQQYWTQLKCSVSLENLLSVHSLPLTEAQSWEIKQIFGEGKGFALALFLKKRVRLKGIWSVKWNNLLISLLQLPVLLTIACFVFQNDDNFLNIIYEAYLFSVRKAAMKKSM